jgi:hypothetical protein
MDSHFKELMKHILTILIIACALHAEATNYYWSSSAGSDANGSNTSSSTPWQTSGKFATFMSAGTPNTNDSILFKRGDTFYGFIISTCNSGINIGAYGIGALPVINGFSSITSWTETTTGSHLWEASVNSGSNLDEVLVNGKVTPAGRTPNTGSYFNIDSHTNLSSGTATITSTGVPFSSQDWTGGEAVIRVNAFNLDRDKITAHSSSTITYSSPDAWNPKSIEQNGNKFFIQKHPATLDQQNEWYYYPDTHVLRMFSMSNPSGLNVQASTQDYFFKVDYRHDISFSNLRFQGLDSFVISSRFPIRYKITGNQFADIGTDAIIFDTDSSCSVTNNMINRCGNSGIVGRGSAHTYISGNIIDSCGVVFGMGLANNQQNVGIMIECYPGDTRTPGDSITMINNYVTHTGYCGIRFTGINVQVYNNFVDSFGLTVTDAGGIYTNGLYNLANQRKIHDNIVLYGKGNNAMQNGGVDGGMPAIYLDDNTGSVDIYNNILSGGCRAGIFGHNAKDINIYNNIIYNNRDDAQILFSHDNLGNSITGINVHDNYIATNSGALAIDLYSMDSDESSMGVFSNNYYAGPSGSNVFNIHSTTYNLAGWKSALSSDVVSSFYVAPTDSMRLEFNKTGTGSTLALGTTSYVNLKKQGYVGNIIIPSFQGLFLIRKTLGVYSSPIKFTLTQQ